MHIPPATDGFHPHGTRFDYEEKSATLLAILKRHGVDAVLSGHEHMHYVADWEGVKVLISGGAGAPLVPFQRYGYYRIDVENGKVTESFRRIRPAGKPDEVMVVAGYIPAPPKASVPVSPSSLSSFHGGRTFRRTKRMAIGRASRTIA